MMMMMMMMEGDVLANIRILKFNIILRWIRGNNFAPFSVAPVLVYSTDVGHVRK
jgi:hypothetical protein